MTQNGRGREGFVEEQRQQVPPPSPPPEVIPPERKQARPGVAKAAPPPELEQSPADQPEIEADQWPIRVKLLYKPIRNNKNEEIREVTLREPRAGDINRYGNPVRVNQDGDVVIDERKMTYIMMELLLGTVPPQGRPGSDARTAINDVRMNALVLLMSNTLGPPLANAFESAQLAGCTLAAIVDVREQIELLEEPKTLGAILVRNIGINFCLAVEGKIIAGMIFVSRQDVDNVKASIGPSFAKAEEIAADSMDSQTYQALVRLHAAINNHLVRTALPLPRVVNYRFFEPLPSLVMTGISRVGDTSREEIAAGGHPGNMRWYLGPPEMRFYWTVHVGDARLTWFRTGPIGGEVGVDHHLEIGLAEELICLLERWKPAHTQITLDYSGLTTGGPMAGTP